LKWKEALDNLDHIKGAAFKRSAAPIIFFKCRWSHFSVSSSMFWVTWSGCQRSFFSPEPRSLIPMRKREMNRCLLPAAGCMQAWLTTSHRRVKHLERLKMGFS